MAVNSIYLRPSADISVGHTLSSGTSGYLLIDESTCDGSSTYLGSTAADANTTSTLTSSFKLSGAIPSEKINVRDAKIVVAHISNQYTNGAITFVVSLNGESFTSDSVDITGNSMIASTETKETTSFNNDNIFVNAINDYISSNDVFPSDITISFTTSVTGESKGEANLKISQVYLELTYDICIYKKVNDEWKKSIAAYQKIDGLWTQINNARSILKLGKASLGHHQEYIPAVAATCIDNGYTYGYKCSQCGEFIIPQEVVPPKGHAYSIFSCGHNICEVCSHIEGVGYGKLVNNGTSSTPLSSGRSQLSATTVGDYALFGGGNNTTNGKIVDVYNKSLTRTIASDLSSVKSFGAATTVGDYALFGGGYDRINSVPSNNVDVYNSSLTKSVATSLTNSVCSLSATTVGDYALFGGGCDRISELNNSTYYNVVNVYDKSLTKTSVELSISRSHLASTAVGNYAFFGGGRDFDNANMDTIDVFDSSLTRTNPDALSTASNSYCAGSVHNYAIFFTSSGSCSVYDTSLTKTTFNPNGSSQTDHPSSSILCHYVIFGGGGNGSGSMVYIYDNYLTQTTDKLDYQVKNLSATTVGDYALFGGGYDDVNSIHRNSVQVFTINITQVKE